MVENPAETARFRARISRVVERIANLAFQRQTIWLANQTEQLSALCDLSDVIKRNSRLGKCEYRSWSRWMTWIRDCYRWVQIGDQRMFPHHLSINSMIQMINSTLREIRLTLRCSKYVVWGGFVSGYRARTKLEFENSTCAKDFEKSQIETRRKSEKN